MRKLTKSQARKRARDNWAYWRLLMADRGFTFQDVFFLMTPQQVFEANMALDMQLDREKKEANKKH